jgi:ssDNA-binding Zn-finger/Zn-ribbon topoisomerase 1
MAIKIEGNKVIVTTDSNAHHITKQDKSIKSNQIGECSICGEVLLIYMGNKSKGWFACSVARKKIVRKYKRKVIEDKIKKTDKYLSVVSDTITNINERI